MKEKVVGITFRPQPEFNTIKGEKKDANGVPYTIGQALLIPEPSNAYDPNAVAVVIELEDGGSAHIGYLPKGTQLYTDVTAPTLARVHAFNYDMVGMNRSYKVEI